MQKVQSLNLNFKYDLIFDAVKKALNKLGKHTNFLMFRTSSSSFNVNLLDEKQQVKILFLYNDNLETIYKKSLETLKKDLDFYLSLKQLELSKAKVEKWDGRFPTYFMGMSQPDLLLQVPAMVETKKIVESSLGPAPE